MRLNEKEYWEFLGAHLDLLYFVGLKKNLFSLSTTKDRFRLMDMEVKLECRDELIEKPELLIEYLQKHKNIIDTASFNLIEGMKKNVMGDFIIFKCLKAHAIFIHLESNSVYAVKALSDPFNFLFSNFPIYVTAVLIPYKDKIVYDGFLYTKNIRFGPQICNSLNNIYKQAKLKNEIISSL